MKNEKNNKQFIILGILISFAICLGSINLTSAGQALNNYCPITDVVNVNFSNGTGIFLPIMYDGLTSQSNSDLTIFVGTDTTAFCSEIDENLGDFSSSRKVVFTPEFLNALKTSSCSVTFESYLENYRKSGDILDSDGDVFCAMKNLTFDSITSPSGIVFNYPIIGEGVIGVSGSGFNAVKFKKYATAYLINHESIAFSGVISSLANAVNLNVSLSCPGVETWSDFFDSGKNNYAVKFKPNLIDLEYVSGEALTLGSGFFGWLENFALGDQVLPRIKVAKLSENIFVCSLLGTESEYSNNSVTTFSKGVDLDARSSVDTQLEIKTLSDVSNKRIKIAKYSEMPGNTSGVSGFSALGSYIEIVADSDLKNSISSVMIKIYYTDAEVSSVGIQESSLRLYYYNSTSRLWVKYDVPNGGVDITENYVWANTTHFSSWGIFGSSASSSPITLGSSGGGGGICIYNPFFDWQCTEWGECIANFQTRACKDTNNCGNVFGKPVTERNCEVKEIIPTTSKLFDIKLELASSVINNAKELSAVTTFASFGNVPTPVDLTYSILDSSGKEVYSEKGNTTVTTEQIVRKSFENLNLSNGKYTLVLITVYGDNIKDEFKQEFSVGKSGVSQEFLQNIKNNWIWPWIIGGVLIFLLIIFVIIYKKFIGGHED